MEPQKCNITIIGLGNMGSAIAKKLLAAGFRLTVYNRSNEKMKPLILLGAFAASSLTVAIKEADIVISALFDDKAVLEMADGENGFISQLKPNATHINISTILPATAKKLTELHKQHNSMYISAPILGIPKAVETQQATSLIAGTKIAVQFCDSIFKSYSARIINLGAEAYKANVMKICTNYLLATAIECMGELYTYAEKSGLDAEFIHGLLHSVFTHKSFLLYADKIKERNFDEVNFSMQGGIKDLNLFQQAFADVGVVPDLGNLLKNKFIIALANGLGDKDWCAVTEVTRIQSGCNK